MKNTKIFLLITSIIISSPAISMDPVDTEKNSIKNSIQYKYKFDEKRQTYYEGDSLSDIKKYSKESTCSRPDNNKTVFSSIKPSENQNLLKASSTANLILHDYELLQKGHGWPVTGKDGRTLIESGHNEYPFHSYGKLISIFLSDDGKLKHSSIGTGTLIGKRTVLTAAHNLYDFETKLAAKLAYFFPGKNGEAHICFSHSAEHYIHNSYIRDESVDLAAVLLHTDFNDEVQKHSLKSMPVKYITESEVISKQIIISGYPGGRINPSGKVEFLDGDYLLTMPGKINNLINGRIFYDVDTSAGQSGSSVCTKDEDGNLFCFGVHIKGGDVVSGNIGTFLNKLHIDFIGSCLSEENN